MKGPKGLPTSCSSQWVSRVQPPEAIRKQGNTLCRDAGLAIAVQGFGGGMLYRDGALM